MDKLTKKESDEKVEQAIRPIKEICAKIEKIDVIDGLLAELKVIIKKNSFYASHSLVQLKLLLIRLDGKSCKIEPILKVINGILNNNDSNYTRNLMIFNNFLSDMKVN